MCTDEMVLSQDIVVCLFVIMRVVVMVFLTMCVVVVRMFIVIFFPVRVVIVGVFVVILLTMCVVIVRMVMIILFIVRIVVMCMIVVFIFAVGICTVVVVLFLLTGMVVIVIAIEMEKARIDFRIFDPAFGGFGNAEKLQAVFQGIFRSLCGCFFVFRARLVFKAHDVVSCRRKRDVDVFAFDTDVHSRNTVLVRGKLCCGG